MNKAYLNVISLIERLHRQFLEVVKLELDGMGIRDINNVQAMVLFNIWRRRDDRGRTHPARLLPRLKC